jgi:tetratricopeptide (TPR) repeat protein
MKFSSLCPMRPIAWLVLLVVACLLPFVNRAFHIDDPLFLWTAQHLRIAPGDCYGFNVNWFGLEMPMTDANCNPPLMSVLIALASCLVGWSEVTLHLIFLLSALAATLGTFQLAKSYCARPALAASLTVLTPCFLLCSTSLMCDTTMLAFWIWSLVLWERALSKGEFGNFASAGLLAGLCILTKYSGLSLLPLLAASALLKERKIGRWAFALIIPLAMVSGYEYAAYRKYGVFLFGIASDFSRQVSPTSLADLPARLLSGLVFAGGCAAPALFLAPCLWSRRALIAAVGLWAGAFVGYPLLSTLWLGMSGHSLAFNLLMHDFRFSLTANWALEIQRALWLGAGLSLVAASVAEYRKRRDASSLFLGMWILGVLGFASAFNWTINGRSILPMLPAVGILLARRLDLASNAAWRPNSTAIAVCLAFAACCALAVTACDYRQANASREAARLLASKYPAPPNNLLFQGHWGFQYYLQKKGLHPLDVWHGALATGDLIAIPANNDIYELPAEMTELQDVLERRPNHWLSVLNRFVGAGFHTDFWGPLPFAFGCVEPERFYIFRVIHPFRFSQGTAASEPPDVALENEELAGCEAKLRTNPADLDARLRAAALLTLRSQTKEAIAYLSESLRIHTNSLQAHALLGSLYQVQRKTPLSKEHYAAALRLMPDYLTVLNNFAWLLATDSDPTARNGSLAVRLAWRACALTAHRRPLFLGTLAAAYAEAGRFHEAITTAEKARALAAAIGLKQIADKNDQLLDLYRAGKPYHETP